MPKKNDLPSSQQTSPSTIRQLFHTEGDGSSSSAKEGASAEKAGFVKRFQSSWRSLLDAMKQSPEAEEDAKEEEAQEAEEARHLNDLAAAEADDLPEEISYAADPFPSANTPTVQPTSSAPEKTTDKEKKGFLHRFRSYLEEEEARSEEHLADTSTDSQHTAPDRPSPEVPSSAAVTSAPAPLSGNIPSAVSASRPIKEPLPASSAAGEVIYTAPPSPAVKEPLPAVPPIPAAPRPPKRRMPDFHVFKEADKDKTPAASAALRSRTPDDANVSAAAPPLTVTGSSSDVPPKTVPIRSTKREEAKVVIPLSDIPPQRETQPLSGSSSDTAVKRTQAAASEASPVTLPPVSADDLLTVGGRSIESLQENTIYNARPATASANEEPDFTESHLPSVTYRYQHIPPFIVMAGKFTKTLREEYNAVRTYRREQAEKPPVTKQPPPSVEKEAVPSAASSRSGSVPPMIHEVPKEVVSSDASAALPLRQQPKAKKEPPKRKPKEKKILLGEWEEYEEIPEEPTVKKSKKPVLSRAEKHLLAKQKRSERRSRIKRLFTGEEEFDPEEEVARPLEPKPQLDDYNEESDAEAIKTEISSNFQAVFARTLILLAAAVVSVTASLLAQCTGLFRTAIRNGWLWFALISFILFAVSVIVSRQPIVNGLMPLRHFKGNSDTAVSVACVAVAIQSVTALFTPDVYLNGTLYLYTPLVIVALLFNAIGKLLIITRTHYNFHFLIKPYPKYAGKIFSEDGVSAQKMTRELPLHKPLIGYTKRTRFASNFLQLSYAPDPLEKMASFIAPWTTVISLVCGILCGILHQNFLGGVSSLALTACISIPMLTLVGINLPLRRLCRNTLRSGAMVTGYETVKQFSDTNAIMIDSSQLYPKGTVTLTGIRSFKQNKLTDALQAGAAIMYAVNGTMIHIFENIVQCSKENLPDVDNVIYEDGKGLVGWIKEQRILIGNRALLKAHNVEPPEEEVEERFRKRGSDVVYISVSGDLIAMFGVSYKTYKHIANELRVLEQSGVNFIVRTVDPNLTREKIAEQFGLFHRCITVLPTGLGNICHELMSKTDAQSRAYLVTRGKLSSFAKAVSGCIKMKMAVFLVKVAQGVSVGVGLLLFSMISCVSGFEKLGCLEMLIYIGFWSLTTLIVSLIKK